MASEVSIEKYVEETIIEYLQSQDIVPEHYDYEEINQLEEVERAEEERKKTIFIVEELLNDIIHDVERTKLYHKKYQKTKEQHHQYALFDLSDYLPGFCIDEHIIKQLCFRETLLISDIDHPVARDNNAIKPLAVGGMCLKIELAHGLPTDRVRTEKEIERNILDTIKQLKLDLSKKTPKGESIEDKLKKYEEFLKEASSHVPSKFVIHLSSEFDINNQNGGSKITSWVDRQFHTIEERRTEYIFKDQKESASQTLYYALQEEQYFIKHRVNAPEKSETRMYCPLSVTKDMIGEGANFLLMRYLAISRYKGNFELSTLYINGSLCRNIYECTGAKPGYVNGHSVELCKIYRTIIEKCGIIHLSVTVLTVYGVLVSQEWEGCPYMVHINPEFVTIGKPVTYDYIALRKVWDTNIEFVSKYLDCKTEAEIKMKTYQKDHPEIHEMIADYLQSVLLLKPEQIIPFTIDYFMSYEPYKLPQMHYFEEEKPQDGYDDFW